MTEHTTKIPTGPYIMETVVEVVTMRDQFAMAALTGFMGSGDCATGNHDATARLAYRFADAMLEARKEKKDG
jgi:hypothetical protein